MSFKKIANGTLVFCLLIILAILALSTTVMAAGKDDGIVFTTNKNGVQYLGTAKNEFCTEFVAANGENSSFYRYHSVDLTSDENTDITDLVALRIAIVSNSGGLDLNFDTYIDVYDLAVLRGIIIGNTDVEIG